MTGRSNEGQLTERLKGKAKKVAGSVLGDDALRHEGELHEEKADHLAVAEDLHRQAALDEEDAELQRRGEALEAEQRALTIDAADDARAERIDRDEQQKEQAAELQQRSEEAAAEAAARSAQHQATTREVSADQEHAKERADARELEAAADRARAEAQALDTAVRTIEEN